MEIPFTWRFSDRCTGTGPVNPVSALRGAHPNRSRNYQAEKTAVLCARKSNLIPPDHR